MTIATLARGRPLRGVAAWAVAVLAIWAAGYVNGVGMMYWVGRDVSSAFAVGGGISVIYALITGVSSAVLAPPIILAIRRFRFPRPAADLVAAGACALAVGVVVSNGTLFLRLLWLALPFGLIGGGVYWLAAGRPRPGVTEKDPHP